MFYHQLLVDENCPECIVNLTNGDWKSALACLATIGIGALIRAIEKRRLIKRLKNESKDTVDQDQKDLFI